MGLRHLCWINQHRILPLALLWLILTDSLHDTFHHSNSFKSKVHRTLWGTLLEVIRATQSLSWWAQILETRPATAHPQWGIIQPSQVYCEKVNATDESTPRRNTKSEVFVKLLYANNLTNTSLFVFRLGVDSSVALTFSQYTWDGWIIPHWGCAVAGRVSNIWAHHDRDCVARITSSRGSMYLAFERVRMVESVM